MKNKRFYAVMTRINDSINKKDKLIVECETLTEVLAIWRNSLNKKNIIYSNICYQKPYYNKNTHESTYTTYDEMGKVWKKPAPFRAKEAK